MTNSWMQETREKNIIEEGSGAKKNGQKNKHTIPVDPFNPTHVQIWEAQILSTQEPPD